MKLEALTKITTRDKKRIGRGIGSGKGKTGGRGMKGQKARGKIPARFIGGTLPLYRKLPMARGRGGRGGHNMRSYSNNLIVDVAKLKVFPKGTEVTIEKLIEARLVDEGKVSKFGVKIVGRGELDVSLTVKLPTTASAREAIEKAKGTVV